MNQSYTYNPQVWFSATVVLFMLALGIQAWRHRNVPGAIPFAIACLFGSLWAAGSVLEYAAITNSLKLVWFKTQIIFQLPATVAVTCFVFEYAWPGRWLTRRNLLILSLPLLLATGFSLTNESHHLMWTSFEFNKSVLPTLGPAGIFFLSFGFGLGLINLAVFIWLFLRFPQLRWPVAIMAFGQFTTRVLYFLELAKVFDTNLPLDILGIAFTFLMYIIALFGFKLFDPIPLAMQIVMQKSHDGMLVLDAKQNLVNLNPAALQMLGCSKKTCLGKPIDVLLPQHKDIIQNLMSTGTKQAEIQLQKGDQERSYQLEVSSIKDWHEVDLGNLLLLRDVTAQKNAQAQIIEQQRALATMRERWRLSRDLHDNMAQVIAFVSVQGQAVRQLLSQGDLSAADTHLARLVETAREADVDVRESILGLRVTLDEHGFYPALEQYLMQYQKNYAIHTELIKPDSVQECRLDPLVSAQLLAILQEALTNIRKHANAQHVEVKFETEPDWITVTVRDDGLGFKPGASDAATGEHIGLRVMRERAEEIGSTLSLHSEPGKGTQVIVRVPLKIGRTNG